MNALELTSLLSSVLARRTSGNQPTLVNLVGDATVFRPYSRLHAAGDRVSLEALVNHQTHWKPVGRFSRVLEPLFGDARTIRGGDGWGGAVLPFLAVFAFRWGVRLARQMGTEPSCPVGPGCDDDSFRRDYLACLDDAKRALQVAGETLDAMIRVVQSPASWRRKTDAPAMLRLEPLRGATRVIWLARDGTELGRETLEELALRMSSQPRVTDLLRRAEDCQRRQADHRAKGDRALEAVCSPLAEAVRHAREHNRRVGYRMCAKRVRGLPAEVYLFVGPGPDAQRYVCAHLVARRAHEEFVLENRARQLFYFPPVQLQAMIEFIPSDPPWRVPLPMVRMPSRQPRWVHPYTGSLHADRFTDPELRPRNPPEAMAGISEGAQRLVPGLWEHRLNSSTAGCLCLGGQDSRRAELAGWLREGPPAERKPDLFGLVWGLWDLIRVGLTRGHQNNGNTPIAELSTSQMPYLIGSAAPLAGTKLAARLFPYHRDAPTVSIASERGR